MKHGEDNPGGSIMRLVARILIVSALSFAVGCGKENRPSPDAGGTNDTKETQRPQPPPPFDPAASEFVEKLKEAFDSWVREVPLDQFRKTHPGLQVFEPTWSLGFLAGDRLTRYQVVSAEPRVKDLPSGVKRRYELVVSLDIRRGNLLGGGNVQVTERNKYLVQENKDGTWLIAIQGRPEPAARDQ
jgi:hypothetical protein